MTIFYDLMAKLQNYELSKNNHQQDKIPHHQSHRHRCLRIVLLSNFNLIIDLLSLIFNLKKALYYKLATKDLHFKSINLSLDSHSLLRELNFMLLKFLELFVILPEHSPLDCPCRYDVLHFKLALHELLPLIFSIQISIVSKL